MRQVSLFNSDWKFCKGDVAGAHHVGFDELGWRVLTLPHDWSIEGPFEKKWASATGFLPGGIGWYRKAFSLPASFASQQVFLHFEGVYCSSEVWINGHFLGRRPNGYLPFRYDLTPHLDLRQRNTIAVKVDHSQFADSRWYTGSGIYRNVFLIATDLVHIKPWGVCVTTPLVTADRAEVQAEVTLQNSTGVAAEVQVRHTLRDSQGTVVAMAQVPATVPAGGEQAVTAPLGIGSPQLWSVEDPTLYVLQTQVLREGQLIDQEETPIGLRSFSFEADRGFSLNGRSLKLKGVCLHEDAGALGTAVPIKVWERRLRLLKAAGVNAIRMAHNPHLPELYDLCDQMGFLVQDEAFDEWEEGKNKWIAGWNVGQPGQDGYHAHFREWAETDLRDMILQGRNHPSIIMWSIGNEIDYPNDPYSHEVLDTGTNPQSFGRGFQPQNPHSDRLGEIARRLTAIAKAVDPTRPVTAALAAALISNKTGFAEALDLVGYNYQEGRYQEDHARYPNRVLYGSENGMRGEFWEAVAANAFISGQFLWTGIDYLGEAGHWPARSNGAGLLDLAGLPKPEYHFRRSLWTDEPMVYLGTRTVPEGDEAGTLWSHQQAEPVWAGTDGAMIRVLCFTNCAQAELTLNGRSLGVKSLIGPLDRVLAWDAAYEPGELTVTGTSSGMPVASASLKTSGPATKIVAETDAAVLAADGMDLAHVIVWVTDEHGVPVYAADHEITWTLQGPGRLLGLESGDHTSHEDYQAPKRRVFHGRQLGYVQAASQSGAIQIRLSAPGLKDALVFIKTSETRH